MLARTSWIPDISIKSSRHRNSKHYGRGNFKNFEAVGKSDTTLWEPPPIPYQKLVGRKEREILEEKAAEVLKTGKSSAFEWESSVRTGLRQGFIARGHGWAHSDMEADKIVQVAFDRIGAVRPDWLEAQAIATISPDYCQRCHVPLDDDDKFTHRRFCSDLCSRATRLDNTELYGWMLAANRAAMRYVAAKEQAPERNCIVCQEAFRSPRPDQDVCSRDCAARLRRTLDDRKCSHCGKSFRPGSKRQTANYCSIACSAEGRRLPPKQCGTCGEIFNPLQRGAKYCSVVCYKSRPRESLPDKPCEQCAEDFTPAMAKTRFCGDRCRNAFYNRRRAIEAEAARSAFRCDPA